MSFCVVNGCKNRKSKKNWEQEEIEKSRKENISFHMFPKDIEKQKKWLAALNLINYTPCKSAAVCSVHFKNSDYVPGAAIKKLQSNAVPHVSISIRVQVNQGEEKSGNESTAGGTIECFQNDPNNKLINNESVIVTSEDNIVDIPENVIRYHNQSTNISPKRVLNSPTKKQIRDVYTEKIKTLQRQLYKSRYKKKETTKSCIN
ncbi:hypothetical protein ABEB36_014974 [Hypothenemus hampei]|uniref:THAP-type domain-containing protein n=1 Tax=Hypothenemus hampei TaxID=57062 RepID=A0ABD1E1G8_HYPHA